MEWLSYNDRAEGHALRVPAQLAEHGIDEPDCCRILAKFIIIPNSHPDLQKSDQRLEQSGTGKLGDVRRPYVRTQRRYLKKATLFDSEGTTTIEQGPRKRPSSKHYKFRSLINASRITCDTDQVSTQYESTTIARIIVCQEDEHE